MRVAIVGVSLLAAASLAACSSSGGKSGSTTSTPPSSPSTTPSSSSSGGATNAALCADISTVGTTLASLASQLSNPTGLKTALAGAAPLLQKLQTDAASVPSLSGPVGDLATQFTAASAALSKTPPDVTTLTTAATAANADGAKLASWAQTNCSGTGASS
jgi:hypothetical protein